MSTELEVIVIGGGPGGSVCAAALARCGHRVLLLEKASFPREHVGESLSPSAWDTVQALGVSDELRSARFAAKSGATFAWGDDPSPWTVAYPARGDEPAAYQVRRGVFDEVLLRAAAAAGAEVRQGWRADEIIYQGERATGVLCTSPGGHAEQLTAPWIVRASGAPGRLDGRPGYLPGPPELENMAVWGYWARDGESPGSDSGSSLLVGHGDTCFWYFPLDDRTRLASVGIVVRPGGQRRLGDDPAAFYRGTIASCDVLASRLSGAQLTGPVKAADTRAYASKQMAGPGWFLVGDAACFVDPLLTPGIQLAVEDGTLAAQTLHTILVQPDAQAQALEFYDQICRRNYETFVRLSCNLYEAAGAAGQGLRRPEARPASAADGQLAFLSLIAGLPRAELAIRLGKYIALRNRAAALGGAAVALGEKEGFAFLGWQFHQSALTLARAERIKSELDEMSVVRLTEGATIRDEVFVPPDGAATLRRRMAATNGLGDRFEATPELVTLFAVIGAGCPYAEARRRFCETMAIPAGHGRTQFRDWLEMLADHGLIEWQPEGRGASCAV
jgi:halogenation protein CepH